MKPKRPAQLQFKALKHYTRSEHGGDLRKGKRKLARPVAVKSPMHLVLRASKATGKWSMLRRPNEHHVSRIIVKHALKNDVHVERFANAGNHLHLVVRAKTKKGFQTFLRTIAGLIPRLITGAVKARPSGKFWDHLAFSRVVKWGKDHQRVLKYVLQNTMEAAGMPTPRKPVSGFKTTLYGFS